MTSAPDDTDDTMLRIDPENMARGEMYFLLNSIIVPRPIAWISTVSPTGVANIAPHSYTTVASISPPTLLFVSIGRKDTVTNLEAHGEFVVNTVNYALAERMNITAADAPPSISEFELAELKLAPSSVVTPPRVADSPVALECTVTDIHALGSDPSFVVYGRVEAVHVARRLFDAQGRVDPIELDAVARMGGSMYSTTRDQFSLVRPSYADLKADQ